MNYENSIFLESVEKKLSSKEERRQKKMNKELSLLFLILLIQLHPGKTTSFKVNSCASEDCSIINDSESEFSMNSQSSKMLLNLVPTHTSNRNSPAIKCPIVRAGYRSCLPSKNEGGPNNRCGTYNRGC
jgi:hypothetical protein